MTGLTPGGLLVLGYGSATLAAGVATVALVLRRRGDRVPIRVTALLLGAAAAGGLAVLLGALGAPGAATDRLWSFGAFVLLPAALVLYPEDRSPAGLGWTALVVVAGAGCLAVGYPDTYARSGLAGLVAYLLVLAVQWWRYEHAGPGTRRALLWLALGCVPGPLLTLVIGFAVTDEFTTPGLLAGYAAAWAGFVTCLGIGLLAPQIRDIRALTVTVAVHVVTGLLVVTAVVSVMSVLQMVAGHPVRLEPGAQGLLAAVCAIGYAPTARLLRQTMEILLLGARPDPLQAASRAGERLADDPVTALRALRESLALPYAALYDGAGRVIASSGRPAAVVVRRALSAADGTLGHLEVGLRPAEPALHRTERQVLAVLAPALAQLVRARQLREQVQASRTAIVTAVEEERRRLRRDLHDGLGPRLTGIAYTADAARNLMDRDPVRSADLLAAVRSEAGEAIAEIRGLVEQMRPASLDQVGLEQTLRQQVRHVLGRDGAPLTVELTVDAALPPLGAAVEVTAYRIASEALTNAARHSGGDRVTIHLGVDGGELAVDVRDNGRSGGPWTPGVGLTSMRERAGLLGGRLDVCAGPDGGRVTGRLPLRPDDDRH